MSTKQYRGYLIDAAARTVTEIEIDGLKGLQAAVGGYICQAFSWPTGETLYVDDEGLFKPQQHFFRFEGRDDQPLAGNGVVVGPERYDDEGEYVATDPPTFPIDEVRRRVSFRTRDQVDAWGKANASEPAQTITYTNERGEVVTEVLARFGSLFGDMPRPADEEDKQ